jgi:outer membrane protein assembly factor BamA
MRTFSRALPTLFLLFALPALSQTYTPKQILIKGADGMDTQQIIGITALKPGSMTKQDIEAALQRLADTGLFNDLNYTVSSDALVVTVTPSAAAQLVPVRFTNFIWWTPSELNVLIQARVPLYQGKLSLKGSMIEQVEAALVAILKQKGIDAEVTPIEGISGNSLALAISRPSIVLGNIDVQGSLPTVASKLADIKPNPSRSTSLISTTTPDSSTPPPIRPPSPHPAKARTPISSTPPPPSIPASSTASVS